MFAQVIITVLTFLMIQGAERPADWYMNKWPKWLAEKGCTLTRVQNKSRFNVTLRFTKCNETSDPAETKVFLEHGYGDFYPAKLDTVFRIYKNAKGKKDKLQSTPWAFDVQDNDTNIVCCGPSESGDCGFDSNVVLPSNDKFRRVMFNSNVNGRCT